MGVGVRKSNIRITLHEIYTQLVGTGKIHGKAVLTSTHKLCFGSKIRKKDLLLYTQILLHKSGIQGGIQYTTLLC